MNGERTNSFFEAYASYHSKFREFTDLFADFDGAIRTIRGAVCEYVQPNYVQVFERLANDQQLAALWRGLRRDHRLLMLLAPDSILRAQQPLFGRYVFYNTMWSNEFISMDKIALCEVPWCATGKIHRFSTRYWIDGETGEIMELFKTLVMFGTFIDI